MTTKAEISLKQFDEWVNKLDVAFYNKNKRDINGMRATLLREVESYNHKEYSYLTRCRNCGQRLYGFKQNAMDTVKCKSCGEVQ